MSSRSSDKVPLAKANPFKNVNLTDVLSPAGEVAQNEKLKEENKSDLTSEGPDATYEGSQCLKWTYFGAGFVGFLTIALMITGLAMYKHYDVQLGSSLPNLGVRHALWNLFVFISIAAPSIGLFRMLSTIGCWWTPAAVSIFQQRVSNLRAVISLFAVPAAAWTILQMMGVTDVFIIIETVLCRLAVVGFQHWSEMYNRYWMDAVMSDNPSETKEDADYTMYGEGWAFLFLAGFWWVAIFYCIEVATTNATHGAPLATAQAVVPAIANHYWILITTVVVCSFFDVLGWVLHAVQYYPNYLDNPDWKETVAQKLRKPHIQEGIQVIFRLIIEVYLVVVVFLAMYICPDGVTTC